MSLADEIAKLDELRQRGVLDADEFQRAKLRLIDTGGSSAGVAGASPGTMPGVTAFNALRRSIGDRWIAGVCGGLARATGLESWAWRLIFTALLFVGGTGLLIYLLLWVFVPLE